MPKPISGLQAYIESFMEYKIIRSVRIMFATNLADFGSSPVCWTEEDSELFKQ